MNHNANDPAFIECMYQHYDQRLQDPALPGHIRQFLLDKQLQLAERYYIIHLPAHQQLFIKLEKISTMQCEQQTAVVNTDAILHMANVIKHRTLHGLPCVINSNSDRIILTDKSGTVLCWVKNHS
jgi:hypothetical protein